MFQLLETGCISPAEALGGRHHPNECGRAGLTQLIVKTLHTDTEPGDTRVPIGLVAAPLGTTGIAL